MSEETLQDQQQPRTEESQGPEPFAIKDCALIALATGKRAQNMRELHDLISRISRDSIYYHFWGGRLRAGFDNPDYHNDFATWAHRGLHDDILAERLALVHPTGHESLEEVRNELLETIEERLDEVDYPPWSTREGQFEFLRSQIVVFDTHHVIHHPQELPNVVSQLSLGSIFYHFIDARRRNEGSIDDFRNWLKFFDTDECVRLCHQMEEFDPYFSSLSELRDELAKIVIANFRRE